MISGLIACLYACGSAYITRRATWRLGAEFAMVHLFVAGLGTLALDVIKGWMTPSFASAPDYYLPAPGLAAINFGMATFLTFVVSHLMYGSIVGAMYKPVCLRFVRGKGGQTQRQMTPIVAHRTNIILSGESVLSQHLHGGAR